MERELVWMILSRAEGVGRVRMKALMKRFPDPADAWEVTVADLLELKEFTPKSAAAVVAVRQSLKAWDDATLELGAARLAGLQVLAQPDDGYSVRLREILDPPPYLFQAGPWQPDSRPMVAIVGTRRPTSYGLSVAERFGRDLAAAGAVVVSGMARGIDAAAHKGALEAGGTTIAVLGGGADVCYPREARRLYEAIRSTGAVLSEQPPGTEPLRENFPERNRIISGLAQAVVVIEAGDNSGTLITTRQAADQGRDVCAVPGPITSPVSVGPHDLIRDGAALVTSATDVLELIGHLEPRPKKRPEPTGLTPLQQQILGWMGEEPRWADDLAEACGVPVGEIHALLTMLELRRLVRMMPSGQYVRIA